MSHLSRVERGRVSLLRKRTHSTVTDDIDDVAPSGTTLDTAADHQTTDGSSSTLPAVSAEAQSGDSGGDNTAVLVGAAIGGLFLLAAVGLCIFAKVWPNQWFLLKFKTKLKVNKMKRRLGKKPVTSSSTPDGKPVAPKVSPPGIQLAEVINLDKILDMLDDGADLPRIALSGRDEEIGDAEAGTLADYLKSTDCCINRIDITNSVIGNEGVYNLLRAITVNPNIYNHLQILRLSDNKISRLPFQQFVNYTRLNELEELDVSNNMLQFLPMGLARIPALKAVNCIGNPIRQETPQVVAKARLDIFLEKAGMTQVVGFDMKEVKAQLADSRFDDDLHLWLLNGAISDEKDADQFAQAVGV
eukprot:GFYU01008091.1.p1 GENE.GFYU01008091.1~~GFYU01008091.1.p1  ORF type:complete len:358 (-),score=49.19 GFYU01008091.1:9-1082(-)